MKLQLTITFCVCVFSWLVFRY